MPLLKGVSKKSTLKFGVCKKRHSFATVPEQRSHAAPHRNESKPYILYLKTIFFMTVKQAQAGTLESGDIFIQIFPAETEGINITLDSTVAYQFGEQIKRVIAETAHSLGLNDARIEAIDKGALDCTVRARTAAAIERATGRSLFEG